MAPVGRALRAFGRFWKDFVIGDAPELFIGTLVVVAAALVLHHNRVVAVVALPLIAVLFLGGSVFRGRAKV